MRCYLFFLFLLSFIFSLEGSNSDSLRAVSEDPTQEDAARMQALLALSDKHLLIYYPDSAIAINNTLLRFAEDNLVYKVKALLNIQRAYIYKQDYAGALAYLEETEKAGRELDNRSLLGMILGNYGICYYKVANYSEASKHYYKAMSIHELTKDTVGQISTYINLGNLLRAQGRSSKSIEYFEKGLELCEKTGALTKKGTILNNIAAHYSKQNNLEKALLTYQKSASIYEQVNDKRRLISPIQNIGKVNRLLGNYDESLLYVDSSLKLLKFHPNNDAKIVSLGLKGETFYSMGNYEKAVIFGEKALQLSLDQNVISRASNSCSLLSRAYKKKKNFKKSLEMYELWTELRDSIESEENFRATLLNQYQYEYNQKVIADSIRSLEEEKLSAAKLLAQKAEAKQQKTLKWFSVLGLLMALGVAAFIFYRLRISNHQRSIIEHQKKQVDGAYQQLDHAFDKLEERNREIVDSIKYAKRIQSAMLPTLPMLKEHLPNSLLLYKPKDIVAGDFYWLEKKGNSVLFAVADCTGHGVPGAIVSVLCNNALNRAVREYNLVDPGKILDKANEIIVGEFESSKQEIKDGMDIAVCSLEDQTLLFSGAHNPLWIIRKGSSHIDVVDADKQPIGEFQNKKDYSSKEVQLNKGDAFYIFSDGFADQFGGQNGKKLKRREFKKLLLSLQHLSIEQQGKLLDKAFEDWKGEYEQIDDVCVLGVQI